MLRAYRKNDYTGEIEGYVIETGLDLLFLLIIISSKRYSAVKSEAQTKKRNQKKIIRRSIRTTA